MLYSIQLIQFLLQLGLLYCDDYLFQSIIQQPEIKKKKLCSNQKNLINKITLVLSTTVLSLVMEIGIHEEFLKLTFPALAL